MRWATLYSRKDIPSLALEMMSSQFLKLKGRRDGHMIQTGQCDKKEALQQPLFIKCGEENSTQALSDGCPEQSYFLFILPLPNFTFLAALLRFEVTVYYNSLIFPRCMAWVSYLPLLCNVSFGPKW